MGVAFGLARNTLCERDKSDSTSDSTAAGPAQYANVLRFESKANPLGALVVVPITVSRDNWNRSSS